MIGSRLLAAGVLLGAVSTGCAGSADDAESGAEAKAPPATPGPAPTPTPVDDDVLAQRYLELRTMIEADPEATANGPSFEGTAVALREIANRADDPHLQANAAVLLGSLYETRKQWDQAVGMYRHASKLVDDDAGPHILLAHALSAAGRHADAAKAQLVASKLDPDNLENWLTLAQMKIEAGDRKGGAEAYAAYEVRRKGLIDGLTLKKADAYVVDAAGRAGIAQALAAAADTGTANALIFALKTEPEAAVREAIARSMGVQRLSGYSAALTAAQTSESEPAVREALSWALAEIERAPLQPMGDPSAGAPPAPASPPSP